MFVTVHVGARRCSRSYFRCGCSRRTPAHPLPHVLFWTTEQVVQLCWFIWFIAQLNERCGSWIVCVDEISFPHRHPATPPPPLRELRAARATLRHSKKDSARKFIRCSSRRRDLQGRKRKCPHSLDWAVSGDRWSYFMIFQLVPCQSACAASIKRVSSAFLKGCFVRRPGPTGPKMNLAHVLKMALRWYGGRKLRIFCQPPGLVPGVKMPRTSDHKRQQRPEEKNRP